jgi:hypothetical protein
MPIVTYMNIHIFIFIPIILELKFNSVNPCMLRIDISKGSSDTSVKTLFEMSIDSISGKSNKEEASIHATLSPIAKCESFKCVLICLLMTSDALGLRPSLIHADINRVLGDDDDDVYLRLNRKGFHNLVYISYVKPINPASKA